MIQPDHFFLVLEGMDGSGKSEISRRLTSLLENALGADRVRHSYEPHNPSAAGDFCRDVLAKRITVSARTLALGFALNRADHNERVIAPFLSGSDPRVLVCDRYYHSSLVYQSTGGLSVTDVWELNKTARIPDLTLFLDASPETCYTRTGKRKGERELFEDRFAETRLKYFSVIEMLRGRGEQIDSIDADGSIRDVLNGIIAALDAHAPDWLRLERLTP
ncbi:MAG: dTMP kinase [Chloroflexota bacterium]